MSTPIFAEFPSANQQSDDINVDTCRICLELLSMKRTASHIPCNHKFHRTCVLKWLESKNDMKCVLCNASVSGTVDEGGTRIARTYPFELRNDELMEKGTICPVDHVQANITNCGYLTLGLNKERNQAVKESKNQEWIDDIEQELEKIRRRSEAAEEYFQFILEKKDEDDEDKSDSEESTLEEED
ncbi:hypothetical protein PMAYCL1PPCAC_01100 [Pristionchus mayeri]|uniref:RING-type domain-containing protein n=1 Tax=Pristionchus mayeri TaxID=1317129 RepID=A0AAN5C4Z9_9BILA|nr:hypothetical protein PMAYCL1PPCAC_01100 [Pristionchus mayeri]